MRFSEAIRLGAMMKPQAFDVASDGVGTCANGAACDAIGIDVYDARGYRAAFPFASEPMVACPVCRKAKLNYSPTLGGNVAHLNDDHRWTREQIADWIETIEAQPALETSALAQEPA